MKILALALGAAILVSLAGDAFARGPGGGGGGPGGGSGGMAGGCAGGGMGMQGSSGGMGMGMMASGQMLTSPGSDYYDQMLSAQVQRAYLQQQYAIAAAQTAKKAERREKIRQSIIARKQQEDAKKAAVRSPGEQLVRK